MSAAFKVVLFCPVRQSVEVFHHVLDAHRALVGVSERWYFDDNAPEISAVFGPGERLLDIPDLPERTHYEGHNWTPGAVSRVAAIKNAAIREFLKSDADALFLVDSDVVLHPETVWYLSGLKLPIVAEVYWTQWQEGETWMPNVWDRHDYQFETADSIIRLASPDVSPVGGLGACTLIRRASFSAYLNFGWVPGLDSWGEDRHFCTRASVLQIPLYADTHYPPFHVYRESQVPEMVQWRADGSDPAYFRDNWLGGDWAARVRASWNSAVSAPVKRQTIAVCLPGEQFGSTWLAHWTDLHGYLLGRGFKVLPTFCYSSNPHITRQALLEIILESSADADYVLWIDDDQVVTGPQVDRLIADLDGLPRNAAVAGWSWVDIMPPKVSAGILTDDEQDTLPVPYSELFGDREFSAGQVMEVGYTGFPAVVMRPELLRLAGPFPFAPISAPKSRWGFTGEDVAFCVHGRARGVRFYIDPKVFVPHLKGRALGISGAAVGVDQAVHEAAGWLSGELKFQQEVSTGRGDEVIGHAVTV